ncbi:PLP-dependent transferase [Hymenopellis radicata]|nr:PLP-dependent transferase [Hymenopellis radicata]
MKPPRKGHITGTGHYRTISSHTMNGSASTELEPTSILHRTSWRPPVAASAHGMYVVLGDGRQLLDAVGGAAVACVGNGVPEVIQGIKDQAEKVSYVYNMQLSNEPAEELAKLLTSSSNGAFDLCGFVSGGSEAMEGVIKLARQYFFETGQPQRTNFIARQLSFHGNTVATLSLAYHPTRRLPYKAILDEKNFHHVSPAYAKRFQGKDETEEQYVERLRQELEQKFIALGPDTVIGFVAETVVGATTGCVPAPKGYFAAMKSVCDKYGALFILDEVMSGMGRMGTMHAWESFGDGAAPDIQAVAKGLGGGYASIGAVLMSKRVANGIRDSSGIWKHGHTYQAHPLACAAALAVQKYIAANKLIDNCQKQGQYLEKLLRSKFEGPNAVGGPFVFDIRGGGLFWAIEFDFSGEKASLLDFGKDQFAMLVQARALEKGVIVMGMTGGANLQGTEGDHIILAPAYNVTNEELEKIVDVLGETVEDVLKSHKK